MKRLHRLLFIINICASLLALCAGSAQAQVVRKKDTPVQAPRTSDPPAATQRLPGEQITVPPAESQPQPSGYELRCRGGFDAAAFEAPIPQRRTPGGETIVVV